MFHLYDKNNDGYLTFGEIKKILDTAFGAEYSQKNMYVYTQWIIKSMDINNDGMLAWYEVYTALK